MTFSYYHYVGRDPSPPPSVTSAYHAASSSENNEIRTNALFTIISTEIGGSMHIPFQSRCPTVYVRAPTKALGHKAVNRLDSAALKCIGPLDQRMVDPEHRLVDGLRSNRVLKRRIIHEGQTH